MASRTKNTYLETYARVYLSSSTVRFSSAHFSFSQRTLISVPYQEIPSTSSNAATVSVHPIKVPDRESMNPARRKSLSPDRHHHAHNGHHKPQTHKRLTRKQLFHLLRRLASLGAAFVYVFVSIHASISTMAVLRGAVTPLEVYEANRAELISHYVGNATIRESKALREVLGDVTTPRSDILYLESLTETSFEGCSTPKFNKELYENGFVRYGYQIMVSRVLYTLEFLDDYELIMPVVDCTFLAIVRGDNTSSRIFYLTRLKTNPEDVYLVITSFSIQSYVVIGEYQQGAAAVVSFSFINDTRATSVDHYFAVAMNYPYTNIPNFDVVEYKGETSEGKTHFQSISRDTAMEPVKEIHTAKRQGFFIKEESSQSNIKNMHYDHEGDPHTVMSVWDWHGSTILQDSWAWVHWIHAVFALATIFNLFVLFLIMFRNLQKGKIWVGDAFASISNTLLYRGAIVMVSCHFNEYWTLTELCFGAGYDTADVQKLVLYPEIGHADILTLFLSVTDIFGYVMKERIDPAFSILIFELGFNLRVEIVGALPAFVRDYIVDYATANFDKGLMKISTMLQEMTPLRLWNIHALNRSNLLFLIATTLPIAAATSGCAFLYVIARKLYRKYHAKHSSHVHYSESQQTQTQTKKTMTLFEIATGAELQNRFGVMSDYDNFVFFKGLKFASADGIYCNGFIIANGRFLLATEDILVIILMKTLRVRFRNVYTYEVDGSKLKQTAQLVYPHTISWNDLWHPNVDILA